MSGAHPHSRYVLDAVVDGVHFHGPEPALSRVDARFRVVAVVLYAMVVVALDDFIALGLAILVPIGLMVHMRLPAGRTLKRMLAMDTFVIFMLITLPFTIPGDAVFTVFGLPASDQGIQRAIEIGLKANAVVLMLMVLLGTVSPPTVGHALARLRVPKMLVHLLLFTIRYIEVLYGEYKRLRVAMRTRGFKAGTNRHTLRTFGYLLGMLLVRALDRSERILQAMKCRGFNGSLVLLDESRYVVARDGTFAALFGFLLVALIALQVIHAASV